MLDALRRRTRGLLRNPATRHQMFVYRVWLRHHTKQTLQRIRWGWAIAVVGVLGLAAYTWFAPVATIIEDVRVLPRTLLDEGLDPETFRHDILEAIEAIKKAVDAPDTRAVVSVPEVLPSFDIPILRFHLKQHSHGCDICFASNRRASASQSGQPPAQTQ